MADIEQMFQLNTEQKNAIENFVEKARRDVPFFYEEGESEVLYVPVDDGELRVFHHKPENNKFKRPIVFFPGFGNPPWVWRFYSIPSHDIGEYYIIDILKKLLGIIVMANMKNQAQKERNTEVVNEAVAWKWRKALIQNTNFNLYPHLNEIENEVFLFHGPKDKFHPREIYYKVSRMIPRSFLRISRTKGGVKPKKILTKNL